MDKKIVIKGARVHNLKNISVNIPRNKFTVISGLSGSGKSSLAFDTLYAESQRRYMESLSAYSKQFFDLLDKPDVDSIEGLPPAISISQGMSNRSPRSTLATTTEIYDYLRLLFAKSGDVHCPECDKILSIKDLKQIARDIESEFKDDMIYILSPILKSGQKVDSSLFKKIKKSSYEILRVGDAYCSIEDVIKMDEVEYINKDIFLVISKFNLEKDKYDINSLIASISTAIDYSNGFMAASGEKNTTVQTFNNHLYCEKCDYLFSKIEPRNFSFNSPHGACPECSGLGMKLKIDPELIIPNNKLSLSEGGIRLLFKICVNQNIYYKIIEGIKNDFDIDINVPIKNLSKEDLSLVLFGKLDNESGLKKGGVVEYLEKKYRDTDSEYVKSEIEKCMRADECMSCHGKRLKKESLAIKIDGKDISEITNLNIENALKLFSILGDKNKTNLSKKSFIIAEKIIKEIIVRLKSINDIGLGYLSLNRTVVSLSGGEAQRIRLATQINSCLSGVLYILDEPSIGLHQRDNDRLIKTLKKLRDFENTVIVIEHDRETILSADYIIDVGPGAGENGGKIIFAGSASEIKKDTKSLTGKYLSNKLSVLPLKNKRLGNGNNIEIIGASEFNLKNIDVKIPLGKLVCITGVSGSGKSTLIFEILGKALSYKFTRAKDLPGKHKKILGLEHIDKVINIDQSPIGRTPRSNPSTYTGLFTYIRDLFAGLPESKMRGYRLGKFSFNVKGGRCETCQGNGLVKIEMNFLPDIYVECEDCHGKRYNSDILEVHYKDKTISDVLDMTVLESMKFFSDIPVIYNKLKTLNDVGLSYVKLGQSATTLSGGEAQRVKLATELSRKASGKTLYILDEPTTGLHFEDIKKLIDVLQKLVDKGNSVLIIEHNLDVIKCADWIIDLGPEGGDKGGEVVAVGTPKEVSRSVRSYTGKYLKELI